MSDIEVLLIDACSELPGLWVEEFHELGELDYYHAIIGCCIDNSLYEFDICPTLIGGQDDTFIVDEFVMRLREMAGLFED